MDVDHRPSRTSGLISVQVVYALADEQTLITLEVAPGSDVEAVIRQSGVLDRHPEIDLTTASVGIFALLVELDQPVSAGDRIEIYRPLQVDPKAQRRERAQRQRAAAFNEGAA